MVADSGRGPEDKAEIKRAAVNPPASLRVFTRCRIETWSAKSSFQSRPRTVTRWPVNIQKAAFRPESAARASLRSDHDHDAAIGVTARRLDRARGADPVDLCQGAF